MPAPLAAADLRGVHAVFTDVDGTLTTGPAIRSTTVAALESLAANGIRVVLVTGRPSGFGECLARTLPVEAVVVENGALYLVRDRRGRLRRVYAQPAQVRARNRRRLLREVRRALRQVPGARLSSDSPFAEVNLAIDYNEQVHLGSAVAQRLEHLLVQRGVCAVRSSIHVNCWLGAFDKLSTVRQFIRREWRTTLGASASRFVYAGDSFNDASMFRAFSLSVGVANVLDVLSELPAPPAFVTRAREGAGFEELAHAVLAARTLTRRRLT